MFLMSDTICLAGCVTPEIGVSFREFSRAVSSLQSPEFYSLPRVPRGLLVTRV